MGSVIIDVSMSIDGFVAGPNDSDRLPLGEDGELLHEWMFHPDRPDSGDDKVREELHGRALPSGRFLDRARRHRPGGELTKRTVQRPQRLVIEREILIAAAAACSVGLGEHLLHHVDRLASAEKPPPELVLVDPQPTDGQDGARDQVGVQAVRRIDYAGHDDAPGASRSVIRHHRAEVRQLQPVPPGIRWTLGIEHAQLVDIDKAG
jgi:hypothetical protein